MANTSSNPVYVGGQQPLFTGQILAAGPGSQAEFAYIGTATITGDASASTATVNYIDGTQALPFTPTAIICQRTGGSGTATVSVVSAVDAANANKTFTVQTSASIPTGTFTIVFIVLK